MRVLLFLQVLLHERVERNDPAVPQLTVEVHLLLLHFGGGLHHLQRGVVVVAILHGLQLLGQALLRRKKTQKHAPPGKKQLGRAVRATLGLSPPSQPRPLPRIDVYIIYRDFHGAFEAGGCSQRQRSEGIAWSWQKRDSADGGREERAARDAQKTSRSSCQLYPGPPRTLERG